MDSAKPKLSVIIPTYKRPRQVLRALKSIQNQTLENFEILLVDNEVSSKTKEIVKAFNQSAKKKAKYVPAPEPGLHNARHTGARVSKSDLLVLTEDEVTFHPKWLEAYYKAFKQNPGMAVAGGPLKPIWTVPPPKWVLDLIGRSKVFPPFSLMEPYSEFKLSKKLFFFGGNMAIRKKVLFKIGGFNPDTTGKYIWGNGDSGLNRKLRHKGYLIGYVPEALIFHHIDKKRMSLEGFCHWMSNEGRVDMYTIFYENGLPKNYLQLFKLRYLVPYLYITCKYWIGYILVKGRKAPFKIKFQLQLTRTKSQLDFIHQLFKNKELQKLVTQKDWI